MRYFGERGVGRVVWLLVGVVVAVPMAVALWRYVGAFLFAVFLYYATRPLYRRLERRVARPNVAVTLTLFAVVLPMVVVVGYALATALQDLDRFLSTHSLDSYRRYVEPYLLLVRQGRLRTLVDVLATDPGRELGPEARRVIQSVFGGITTVAGLAVAVLSRFFLMIIFLFYLLRDDGELHDWFYRSVDADARVVGFLTDVDADLEIVFFGNLAIVAVTGGIAVLTYLALDLLAPGGSVVGIPVLLGLLTGLGTLVPVIGMKLVYVPYAVYLLALAAVGGTPVWHPVAFFVVTLVVVDTIPDFFIRSYLAARGGVHMGLVLLGYVLGTMAFGWYGLFLGPLVVVVAVHFARSVFPWLAGELAGG